MNATPKVVEVGGWPAVLDRAGLVAHVMAVNPPEQVAAGVMTPADWAERFLSDEPAGHVLARVHPGVLIPPVPPGRPDAVAAYATLAGDAPPVVVDANRRLLARAGGGRLDRAGGVLPHVLIDGKHRHAAALVRGDGSILAYLPASLAAAILAKSRERELDDFARRHAAGRGHEVLEIRDTGYGTAFRLRTPGGEREWLPRDVARIAETAGWRGETGRVG